MKIVLTTLILSSLMAVSAQAMVCEGVTYSGKKVTVSFSKTGLYPSTSTLTDAMINVNGQVAGAIKKARLVLETNHDQVILKSNNGLPSVSLMYAENAEREDRDSRMTVVLKNGTKYSFTDVDCRI